MIYVTDEFNLVPELFDAYPDIVKADQANIDILPVMVDNGKIPSDNFTIFVQPEPDMNVNHLAFVDRLKARPNHVFAVSGFSSDNNTNWKNHYILNFSNLTMTLRVNKDIPMVQPGPKTFAGTLLVGGWTKNRSTLMRVFKEANILDNFLTSYFARIAEPFPERCQEDSDLFYRTPMLNHIDNPEFIETVFDDKGWGNTCRPAKQCIPGQHHWVSQFMVYEAYNSAYISVIAETETNNFDYSFFVSEKIAKPLIVGQPFVVFGGQHYLKNLRNLGFKTFSNWIDESYDDLPHQNDRAKAVANSAIKFARMPDSAKQQALVEMQPIVQHNRNLVLDKKFLMKSLADEIINFSTNQGIV